MSSSVGQFWYWKYNILFVNMHVRIKSVHSPFDIYKCSEFFFLKIQFSNQQFDVTFNNISVTGISWRSVLLVENLKKTTDLSQDTDKLYHIMLYTSPWLRFELATSVVYSIEKGWNRIIKHITAGFTVYKCWQLISKFLVHYLISYPLDLYINYIFKVNSCFLSCHWKFNINWTSFKRSLVL
jgi:hypothetical protein